MSLTYSENFDAATVPANPAGWTDTSSSFDTSAAISHSSPNALKLVALPIATSYMTYSTGDGSGSGAMSLSLNAYLQVSSTPTGFATYRTGVSFRGSSASLNNSSTSTYAAWIEAVTNVTPVAHQARLMFGKIVSGSVTLLNTVFFGTTASMVGQWFQVAVTFSGGGGGQNAIQVQLQRVSDGFSLDNTGTFVSGSATAISLAAGTCDNSLTTGEYHGIIGQAPDAATCWVDDWSVTSSSTGSLFSAAVATTVTLTPADAEVRDATSATPATFALAPSSSEIRDVASAALATVSLAAASAARGDKVAAVTTTVTLTPSTTGAKNSAVFTPSVQDTLWLIPSAAGAKDTAAAALATISLSGQPARTASPILVSASANLAFRPSVSESAMRLVLAQASDTLIIAPSALAKGNYNFPTSVAATIRFSPTVGYGWNGNWVVSASDVLVLTDKVTESSTLLLAASVKDTINFAATVTYAANKVISATTVDTILLAVQSARESRDAVASVADTITFTPLPIEASNTVRVSQDTLRFTPSVTAGREIHVSVLEHLALAGEDQPPVGFSTKASATTITFVATAAAMKGPSGDLDPTYINFAAYVSAKVSHPPGSIASPVLSGLDPEWPLSFALTPEGDVLMANGVDRMAIWKALPATADWIGIVPPDHAVDLGGFGAGIVTGRRVAFCRFIDAEDRPSGLSPVGDVVDFGFERPIDDIAISSAGAATITALAHGLATGEQVVIRDVRGLVGINGPATVTKVDDDRLLVSGAIVTGTWLGGGSVVVGIGTVAYSNVPVPAEDKVVRRQVLRNLEGTLDALYVDIDTTDLATTSFYSTLDDEALRQNDALIVADIDNVPWAGRFLPPPSNKNILATYAGRCWAGGDVAYTTGCVLPVVGDTTMTGVGTNWKRTFAGRLLYVSGARQAYSILAVDEEAQVLTLDRPVGDTNLSKFSLYSIRSASIERKLIYFSDPGDMLTWPPGNALAVPDDGDEVVGLHQFGQALCVVERQHIYRVVCRGEPDKDANLFLMAYRGCVNGRCAVQAEQYLYMLDEGGIHRYDGSSNCEPITQAIQNVFQADGLSTTYQIDWASTGRKLWHASVDPARTTIRWFVDFSGQDKLHNALCHDYRTGSWWIEHYPFPVSSSCTGTIGHRRAIAGADIRRVVCLSEGETDLVDPGTGTIRGRAASGTSLGLADPTAAFPSSLAGVPVAIVDGTGRGQAGVIVENTADTVTWRDPWAVAPDSTSVYQIGGVDWEWVSGWMDVVSSEADYERDVTITYQPQDNESIAQMRVFYDHGDTPESWAMDWSADGVTALAGDSVVSFDLGSDENVPGYRYIRLKGHQDPYSFGTRYIQVQLAGVQNASVVRIYQVKMCGAEFTPAGGG